MNNFRMMAYTLIAIGLINWDYQRGNSNVVLKSLIIILPGFILLLLTFLNFGKKLLSSRRSFLLCSLIAIVTVIFAFINR